VKKTAAVILTAIMLISLFGCSVFDSTSLLALPELSPEHAALAGYINAMTSGTSWSVAIPESGDNRTAMQFVDFYGDGLPEAVVFYKNEAEFALRICVYAKSGQSSYTEMCRIDGAGDRFVSADYTDLNGDGSLEFVVGMEYGSSAEYALKIYSLANNTAALIMDTTSADRVITDMDGDGVSELLVVGVNESGNGMSVGMYRHATGGSIALAYSAPLSYLPGTDAEIFTGKFNSNMRAVVFESSVTVEGVPYYVSDCVTYTSRSGLESLSFSELYGYSYSTLRTSDIMVADVNSDGFLELPLPAYGAEQKTDAFINWYYYDSFGYLSLSCTTYTNFSGEGWYLVCPDAWLGTVYSVTKTPETGLRSIEFFTDYNSRNLSLLKLYVLSEDYVETSKPKDEWFTIAEAGGYMFCGELPEGNTGQLPEGYLYATEAEVRGNFATTENGIPVFAGQ